MSPESRTSTTQPSAHITPNNTIIPTVKAWHYYMEDQGLSPHTIKAFTADLNLFASYFPPDRPIGNITTVDINQFLDWMQSARPVPCSPKTLARRITSIKAFFRWLHQNAILLIDPAEKVPQQSVLSPLPEVLNSEELEAVLKAAEAHQQGSHPDSRPFTLLALLLATGIKKGECLALKLNHVETEAPSGPFLFVRYASPQNRYKERKIPLPDDWILAFQEYQSQYRLDDRLFPWSPRRLEYLLEDIGEEAQLEKHLSFDMCRWTCALNDWRTGMDMEKIRQKLGISKIQWREISMKLQRLAGA